MKVSRLNSCFVPEDVCISQDANLPEGCRRLTNGVIEEVNFVGAYQRLTVRLDLTHRQQPEDEAPLYQVTINTPERMTGVPIIVTRPKPEANASALQVRRSRGHRTDVVQCVAELHSREASMRRLVILAIGLSAVFLRNELARPVRPSRNRQPKLE